MKKKPMVLTQDLNAIRKICKSANGCWVPPTAGPVPCRAHGDDRSIDDLPTLAPHRWVWSVAHGYAFDPGVSVHIRRKCSTKRCCNPDHLFATTSDGVRLSKSEFKHHMKQLASTSSPSTAPRTTTDESVVKDLTQFRAMCFIDKRSCWIPQRSGRVALRLLDDLREDSQLPRLAPHRIAFMLANRRGQLLDDTEHVRRKCKTKRCCNPEHLYIQRVDRYLAKPDPMKPTRGKRMSTEKTSKGVVVVAEDLAHIKHLCQVSDEGCWLPSVSSQCACRSSDDTRPPDALPRMALHRWAWLVANGHAGQSFPGDLIHVRRTCKGRLCCNPEHLYAASPDGTLLSADQVSNFLDAETKAEKPHPREPDEVAKGTAIDDDEYLRNVLLL